MRAMPCYCGNETEYEHCCGPYLSGAAKPDAAEALMRSRYTAYGGAGRDVPHAASTTTRSRPVAFAS